jgi:hypothetical protein
MPLSSDASVAILAKSYRDDQLALGQSVSAGIRALWGSHIDPAAMADSWGSLRKLIFGLVDNHYQASAASAARYYQQSRVISDLGHFAVPQVHLDQDYLARSLDSQTLGSFFHQVKELDTQEAADISGRAAEASGSRLAMRGGRDTITQATIADPHALGWERIISAGACGFCAMLASRGAVYKERSVQFRAHDHCTCTAQVIFEGQEPTGKVLTEEWRKVTAGKSGAAARSAWEEHWSKRDEQPIK